jgi:hypothetical protein
MTAFITRLRLARRVCALPLVVEAEAGSALVVRRALRRCLDPGPDDG